MSYFFLGTLSCNVSCVYRIYVCTLAPTQPSPNPLSPLLYSLLISGLLILTAYRISELVSDLLEVFQADPSCFGPENTAGRRFV